MIPVNILKEEIIIKNIEFNELNSVLQCINESRESYKALGRENPMDNVEIEERYLESLMNPLEVFCGIFINNELIGILKGRIENKTSKELWILSFLFFKNYRNKGYGKRILKYLENYFCQNYSINKVCILTISSNKTGNVFWETNGYQIARITRCLFLNNESKIIILEKSLGKKHKISYS